MISDCVMHPHPRRGLLRGFSLLELVIVIGLIVLLVGVVSLRSGAFRERSQVARLLQLTQELEAAARSFHQDTGEYAREYPNQPTRHRELSARQEAISGWNGPYLELPLADFVDNPFGHLRLYDRVTANDWIPGFDLDGDGGLEVHGDGCMLYLAGIKQEIAQQLDESLDSGVPGEWASTGSLRWSSERDRAYVLVYH